MSVPQVPVSDRGFRFGLGVFETVVVRNGKAELRHWHEESWIEASRALGLADPDLEKVKSPPGHGGIWRWFQSDAGTTTWWNEGIAPVAESMELEESPIRIGSAAWSSRFKTLAYLSNLQAKPPSASAEVVLLNERGEIASAAMANLFWVVDGVLETPLWECGCRKGVVRRWILEESGKVVREVAKGLERLSEADEIFLTNSRLRIVPVTCWRGKKVGDGPGPVTRELQKMLEIGLDSAGKNV
jgi:branched-chain amino acid aminotransferase/4-amino-4-deoxychorismate lyase